MIVLLAIVLCLLCAGLIAWGLVDRKRVLEFPFLAAWAVALQILPQLYAVRSTEVPYPEDGPSRVLLMTIFCLAMTAAGYSIPGRRPAVPQWRFEGARLLIGATVLVGVGQLFGFLIRRLPEDVTRAAQWSGTPVAYLFFANLAPYGFAIALALFLKFKNTWAFLLLIPNLISTLATIILYGRRTVTATFFLTILCLLWFTKRWLPPRTLVVVGLLVFGIFVFSAGDYRHVMISDDEARWAEVREIDFLGNLRPDAMVGGSTNEMVNAMYYMSAVSDTREFDLGLSLYNGLVAAYVPRQLVGEAAKASLMVDLPDQAFKVFGYEPNIGSCQTGIAEAFLSFWYLGCLLYFLLGLVMRRLWDGAMAGSLPSQVIYVSLLALYLGTYDGTIQNFTVPWVHLAVFLLPVFAYARSRRPLAAKAAALAPGGGRGVMVTRRNRALGARLPVSRT